MKIISQETTTTHLEQFYQEVLTNPVLQEKLATATDPNHLCQLALKLGKEQGYHFALEEVQAAMAIEVALSEHQLLGPVLRPRPCTPSCYAS